ncbi:MAG: hypothetical protein ABIO44_06765 [Saprospiraceae bacterium]
MNRVIFKLLILGIFLTTDSAIAQFSIVKMLDQAPVIPITFGTAFMNSKLITTTETLLDGREFKRVKSWEPAYDLKKYSDLLDSYISKIDARAESNSFSLSYNPVDDPESKEYLKLMTKVSDSLTKVWKTYSKRIVVICPDFMPLGDDYGCDEISASGQKLNYCATQKNEILVQARNDLKPLFDLAQRYFNKLYPIDNPMLNNEVLNEISKPIQVLQEWNFEVNAANSIMVETGVSLNNALCGK